MKKVYLSLVIVFLSFLTWSAIAQTSTYFLSYSTVSYIVPPCTYKLSIDLAGAQGGTSVYGNSGGLGGRVQANLSVTPGETVYVTVGGQGSNAGYNIPGSPAGYNGGGRGSYEGGAGGGSSDIRIGGTAISNIVAVAAGGGGASAACGENGGDGGGTNGNNGNYCGYYSTYYCGGGASQSAGGAGASYGDGSTPGGLGYGGQGSSGGYTGPFGGYYYYYNYGGGGGGGYYGGGGGLYGSGGGGSSYPTSGATTAYCSSVTNSGSFENGNGYISITPSCNAPGSIIGSSSVCAGSNITLSNPTAGTGPVPTWSSSNTGVATVTSSGVVTGVTAGTATITYSICNVCGSVAVKTITVNPLPNPITGPSSVCIGQTINLSSTSPGGTWTSSNSLLASIGSASGIVTGVSVGTPAITYTLAGGCLTTSAVSVLTSPAAITGAAAICPASTLNLSDVTSLGTWTSSNSLIATIGSTTGLVTGIAGGTPTISYTLSDGCFSTTTVTVDNMSPISGTVSICLGTTTTLSDLTPGGTWSSSNNAIASVAGGVVTGVSLGSATISYFVSSVGCTATITVFVTGTPSTFSVVGGGSYCSGGTGVTVGLSGSSSGATYTLFDGATAIPGAIVGSGFSFNFPAQTGAGTYGIIANYGLACAATMSGTVNITINPLPTAFSVTGGGSFCSGGAGLHVFLSSSTIGVNYQLLVNTGGGPTPIGSVVAGTGASLDFGAQTTQGTYTVSAVNATTTCVNNMTGSATISTNPLPTSFNVTPTTGGYCTGGTGVTVGLNGSVTGTNYQLMLGGSPVGLPVAGTGSAISFGLQTTPGIYTVVATNTATGCSATMTGSSVISINALPTVYTMTGGGAYCLGGSGVTVGLNGSQAGVTYQLYNGVTLVGSIVVGTGTAISFGIETAIGSYTAIATNATTSCQSNMFGSVNVSINPLPTVFTVTGGGQYCVGSTGVHVGLSGSVVGTNYQLLLGVTVVGAASGTGSSLDFGIITTPGTYSVLATNATTLCAGNMAGSVNVTANPLPVAYTVTGGGAYCASGAGLAVGLSNSQSGVSYQLLRAGIPTGAPVAGTGIAISFGLQTVAGSYTVVATNTTTTCTNNMTGSATITINPLPTLFTVTGGGGYCTGGTGLHIGLSASDLGVSYQLYNGAATVGIPITGIGSAIDFGVIAPAGTYTVAATNPATTCTRGMAGNAVITINPLPAPFAVTGGGPVCAGGTGVPVGLVNSVSGINYQLIRGITVVGTPVPGSGSAITFGPQTVAGTYTAVATSGAGCSFNMTGSATVTVNPLPAAFTVSGTGSLCAGGTGLMVNVSGSAVGVNYQLYLAGVATGAAVPGTGSPVVFGPETSAGNYTVTAMNTATTCTNNMAGSATITVNPLPGLYLVTGGGNYCAGGTGVHVGLSGSTIGVNYLLYINGLPSGLPMPGTSASIDFGTQTTSGVYAILATNTTTSCAQFMTGSVNVVINPLPPLHNVTGGGNYCPGGTGSAVGLTSSDAGVSYQLYDGITPAGSPVAGSGAAISFGLQTATGTYTVAGTNSTTGCSGNMTGSVTIGLFPLPTIYNVTGGGNYCPGGLGVHVGSSGTSLGVSYQLYRSGVATGSSITGTGFSIDFGLQTTPGTYTIVAMNSTTGCTNNMNGNAVINISPLPAVHNVTGGGDYCAGGIGIHIGIDGSNAGTYYQLYNGITAVGSPMSGTGLALDFGLQATAGTYTVNGTGTSTGCTNTMAGSVAIIIDPLPTVYTLTGGGNYCSGGAGSDVMLSGSDAGTNYQLFVGATMAGSSMPGTGSSLDFGMQTAAGIYTVVATNATMCSNNMTGSVTIAINPLPTAYNVTGGGVYCAGGSGLHVMVSGSDVGTQYQLMINGSASGAPMAGTGFGLDFGSQTVLGLYTVTATNTANTCSGNMTGSVTIGIAPLPTVYTVSGFGSSYCAGGTGIDISLSGSDVGTNYQLYNGTTALGSTISGTGLPIDFGTMTLGGTYTVVAINGTTTCTNNMSGSAVIAINPLPVAFTVTGGGSYCNGGAGVNVGLGGSNVGVTYQLYNGLTPMGSIISGTGSALSFGLQTVAGTYTVVASNSATTCSNTMLGSATVAISAQPAAFTVTGGGNYCSGTGGVHIGLSGSVLGTNYQLLRGGSPVGSVMAGTGFSIDFGSETTAGTYTVVATNTTTTCSKTMSGSVVVGINTSPTAYAVIGGGNYCPGGIGVHVGVSGSSTGISYQLFNGTTMVGAAMPGSGTAVDFGLQTAPGTYTVVATNGTTGCTSAMTGSVNVVLSPLPAIFGVVGGGNYCAGGSGVHVGLTGSATGISYQVYNGFTAVGAPVIGTGAALDLGLQTLTGSFTVIATDGSTMCTSNMTGSVTVGINPSVTPAVTISTGVGDTICSGATTTFTAMAVNGGSLPTYQWTVNGVVAGVGGLYSYVPLNGDVIGVTVTSSAVCATPVTATNTIAMAVYNSELPSVSVSANPGTDVCAGTIVTFTAAPSYGGTAPTYSWIKNSVNSGSGPVYSYTPVNGDVVYVTMSSNYHCRLANNVSSAHMAIEVDQNVLPVVSIADHPVGTIAPGQSVTFIATIVSGGGPTPSFQWLINGIAVPGAVASSFTSSNFENGDSVTCQVLSSGGCPGNSGFNSVIVHVMGVGVTQISSAGSDIKLVPNPNNGTFTLKGTLGTTVDQEVSLEITDMLGQVVYHNKVMVHNGDINEKIQLNGTIANGMYMLNLHSDNENKVFHVVIEQ